jgi:hypothetical protein
LPFPGADLKARIGEQIIYLVGNSRKHLCIGVGGDKKKKQVHKGRIKEKASQVLVACACNPSSSGGRDQEDHSSKPARANSSARPYLEKTLHKKRPGGVAQGVGSELKPQYCQKRERERESYYHRQQSLTLLGTLRGSL